jgi:hypothetical protein
MMVESRCRGFCWTIDGVGRTAELIDARSISSCNLGGVSFLAPLNLVLKLLGW